MMNAVLDFDSIDRQIDDYLEECYPENTDTDQEGMGMGTGMPISTGILIGIYQMLSDSVNKSQAELRLIRNELESVHHLLADKE